MTNIDLVWSASTDNVGVAGYNVYRDGTFLAFTSVTFASDPTVMAGVQYCYAVSARDDAANESPLSSRACAARIPCGLKDQPCCPGVWERDACAGDTVCVSSTCVSCGAVGQPCCPERDTCTTPQCLVCTAPLSICIRVAWDGVLSYGDWTCIGAELSDPDLRPGFPREVVGGWPAVVVDDVDGEPGPEILVSTDDGLYHAFKSDGRYAAGWPAGWYGEIGAGMFSTGPTSAYPRGSSIFSTHPMPGSGFDELIALSGDGQPLPGWPVAFQGSTLPALAAVGGDEWLFSCGTYSVYAYRTDTAALGVCGGWPLGWPVFPPGTGQLGGLAGTTFPAVADLDGDGLPEIVVIGGAFEPCGASVWCHDLWAIRADGSLVSGLDPLRIPGIINGDVAIAAIGDVNGDGKLEVVTPPATDLTFGGFEMQVVSSSGRIVRTVEIVPNVGDVLTSPPVLADLDGDGIPEIVVQLDNSLHVFTASGELPGFPVTLNANSNAGHILASLGNSIPVVGDIDGDGAPDIVVMAQITGTPLGDLHAFRIDGSEVAGFPKRLVLGGGAVSAIADLDGDGANELIARGPFALWVFDSSHGTGTGRIEWGQLGAGPGHAFAYPAAPSGTGTASPPSCVDPAAGTCSPTCGASEICLPGGGGAPPACQACGGWAQTCCADCGCQAPATCLRQGGAGTGCCYPCGCQDNGKPCSAPGECCSQVCTNSVCQCAPQGAVFPAPLVPDRIPCCALSWTVSGCQAQCVY
ncbi:MAG TPA: VCBS repeat-containing protein [Anaeromyxobacteraceae bacterium]|nr:VCBS repeat-containing protein [Anaeromyxobacteraceae bacterium]